MAKRRVRRVLHLVDGVSLLRPEEQMFAAMLTGFANRQLARNPARTSVESRENAGRGGRHLRQRLPVAVDAGGVGQRYREESGSGHTWAVERSRTGDS